MNNNALHEIKQTKENSKLVNQKMLNMLKQDTWTKKELAQEFYITERQVRKEIQLISLFFPVVALSSKGEAGYRVIDTEGIMERNDPVEKAQALEMLQHQANEHKSRIKMLKKKMKYLIASMKVLEK